jgi:hypothetical protein
MTKRDQPKANPADLRGWAAKKLEDYELARKHVDDDPRDLDTDGR